MLRITGNIALDPSEIEERFVRSSGPGGQNVNKVATAVQLRFDVEGSDSLPPEVAERLKRLAGHRMTSDGVLVIDAQRYRTQSENREDARERLADLIRRAARKPKVRRATKPTRASKERRLKKKRERSQTKKRRRRSPTREDW